MRSPLLYFYPVIVNLPMLATSLIKPGAFVIESVKKPRNFERLRNTLKSEDREVPQRIRVESCEGARNSEDLEKNWSDVRISGNSDSTWLGDDRLIAGKHAEACDDSNHRFRNNC